MRPSIRLRATNTVGRREATSWRAAGRMKSGSKKGLASAARDALGDPDVPIDRMDVRPDDGYVKALELQGVGYKAEPKPFGVNLVVGLSHQVPFKAPDGITLKVETPTLLKVEGIDKELVGQVAAEIRAVRPPEPYKGKGIRYQGEQVRRKAGKTGAK